MLILGIETSCDETGIALYDDQKGLIDHILHSQVALHAEYGGVVPELASRDHIRLIMPLIDTLLKKTMSIFLPLMQLLTLLGLAYQEPSLLVVRLQSL